LGGPRWERENDLRRPGWRGKRMVRRRPRVEPTDEWQELLPLCWWPEQVEYERIRQPVLFGDPVPERAEETDVSESTLRRRIESFQAEGIEGLLSAEKARKRTLPPNVRRLIVDLKAEYPPFNLNEIANVVPHVPHPLSGDQIISSAAVAQETQDRSSLLGEVGDLLCAVYLE